MAVNHERIRVIENAAASDGSRAGGIKKNIPASRDDCSVHRLRVMGAGCVRLEAEILNATLTDGPDVAIFYVRGCCSATEQSNKVANFDFRPAS